MSQSAVEYYELLSIWEREKKAEGSTFSAFFIPFANKSSITARKTRAPLKWRLVIWFQWIKDFIRIIKKSQVEDVNLDGFIMRCWENHGLGRIKSSSINSNLPDWLLEHPQWRMIHHNIQLLLCSSYKSLQFKQDVTLLFRQEKCYSWETSIQKWVKALPGLNWGMLLRIPEKARFCTICLDDPKRVFLRERQVAILLHQPPPWEKFNIEFRYKYILSIQHLIEILQKVSPQKHLQIIFIVVP